jgi:hypothetical protein
MGSVQRALKGGLLGTLLTVGGVQNAVAEQVAGPPTTVSPDAAAPGSTPAAPGSTPAAPKPGEPVPGDASAEAASTQDPSAQAASAQDPATPTEPPTNETAGAASLSAAPAQTVALDDTTEELTPSSEGSAASEEAQDAEPAKENHTPAPFRKGNITLSLGLGWSSSGDSNWTILGIGGGYFAIDGLKAGLNGTFWIGDKPFVSTITPELTYIFTFVPVVQPYVGAFYRHYFVSEKLPDTDSIGGRAGALFVMGRNLFLGGGVMYEHFLDEDVFVNRDYFSPEIIVGFSF